MRCLYLKPLRDGALIVLAVLSLVACVAIVLLNYFQVGVLFHADCAEELCAPEARLRSIHLVLCVTAIPSFLGCLLVILTYACKRSWRRHPSSLTVSRAIADAVWSAQFICSYAYECWTGWLPNCSLVSPIVQFSLFAGELYLVMLCVDLLLSANDPFTNFAQNRLRFHALVIIGASVATIGITTLPNFFAPPTAPEYGCPIFGPAPHLSFCWIRSGGRAHANDANPSTWLFFYLPLALLYVLSGGTILVSLRRLSVGLSKTYDHRRNVILSSIGTLLCYAAYWLIAGVLLVVSFALPSGVDGGGDARRATSGTASGGGGGAHFAAAPWSSGAAASNSSCADLLPDAELSGAGNPNFAIALTLAFVMGSKGMLTLFVWIRAQRFTRSTGGVGTSGGGGTKSGGGDDPGLLPRAAGAAPSSPSIAASGAASSANLLSPHLNEALRAEILEYTRGAIIDATLAAAEALRDRAIDVAARQVLGDGLGVATASPRGSYGAMAPAPERELRAAGGSGYAAPADYASSAATLIPRRRTASSVDANREVYQKAQLLEDLWLSEAALGAGDIMDFAYRPVEQHHARANFFRLYVRKEEQREMRCGELLRELLCPRRESTHAFRERLESAARRTREMSPVSSPRSRGGSSAVSRGPMPRDHSASLGPVERHNGGRPAPRRLWASSADSIFGGDSTFAQLGSEPMLSGGRGVSAAGLCSPSGGGNRPAIASLVSVSGGSGYGGGSSSSGFESELFKTATRLQAAAWRCQFPLQLVRRCCACLIPARCRSSASASAVSAAGEAIDAGRASLFTAQRHEHTTYAAGAVHAAHAHTHAHAHAHTSASPSASASLDSEYFVFEDFEPHVFRQLRRAAGWSNADYVATIAETADESFGEGASGAFMYFSRDRRVIVKSMTEAECTVLRSMCCAYAEHVVANPGTFLCKYLGVHSIVMYGQPIFFTVMANCLLAGPGAPIHEVYDLKGSWVRRAHRAFKEKLRKREDNPHEQLMSFTRDVERTDGTLKDNDLNYSVDLPPGVAATVTTQLRRDIAFLARMGVMDYSLVLGVSKRWHRVQPERSGLAGCAADRNRDRSDGDGGGGDPEEDGAAAAAAAAEAEAAADAAEADAAEAGIAAHRVEGPARYYLGVIDCLQTWSFEKQAERWFKVRVLGRDGAGISVLDPAEYAKRFDARVITRVFGE